MSDNEQDMRLTGRAIRELLSIFGAMGMGPEIDVDDLKKVSFGRVNRPGEIGEIGEAAIDERDSVPLRLWERNDIVMKCADDLQQALGFSGGLDPQGPLVKGVRTILRLAEEGRQ